MTSTPQSGRTALVTGATSGIGRATAEPWQMTASEFSLLAVTRPAAAR